MVWIPAWIVLPAAAAGYGSYVLWLAGVMVAIMAAGVVLAVFRKKVKSAAWDMQQSAGFSIEALESMRRSGQIDEAEFKAMRRIALGLDAEDESVDNAASSDAGPVSMNDKPE